MSLKQGSKNIVNDAIIKEIAEAAWFSGYHNIAIKVHGVKLFSMF